MATSKLQSSTATTLRYRAGWLTAALTLFACGGSAGSSATTITSSGGGTSSTVGSASTSGGAGSATTTSSNTTGGSHSSGSSGTGSTTGPSTTSSSGTGGSSGASTSGNSGSTATTSSGGGYAGGCDTYNYSTSEWLYCGPGGETSCSCGMTCVHDPSPVLATLYGITDGSGQFCETPCSTSADCPDPVTTCIGGTCTFNTCPVGNIYTSCGVSSAGAQDGTCLPFKLNNSEADLCVLNGTAPMDGGCLAANQSRTAEFLTTFANNPSQLCAPGLVCDPVGLVCRPGCDPLDNTPACAVGTCVATDSNIQDIGDCYTP